MLLAFALSHHGHNLFHQEKEKYISLVACAHEIAQVAAGLAEEAREIEKYADTLVRRPHSREGRLKVKDKLMLPPVFDETIYQKWLKSLKK